MVLPSRGNGTLVIHEGLTSKKTAGEGREKKPSAASVFDRVRVSVDAGWLEVEGDVDDRTGRLGRWRVVDHLDNAVAVSEASETAFALVAASGTVPWRMVISCLHLQLQLMRHLPCPSAHWAVMCEDISMLWIYVRVCLKPSWTALLVFCMPFLIAVTA